MNTAEQILAILEDAALQLQKAQTNLKKCPKVRLTKGYIEARIESLNEYWKLFKKYHEELVKCVPKEKKMEISYFENEDYFVYEDLYICMKADLSDLLTSLAKSTTSSASVSAGNSSEQNQGFVKLPRIQLPTFSGIYEEWPAYQDLFTSLVHNNASLSNVQRLHYLKSSLSGEAESLLKHVQVTESNYEQSWSMLKTRYGNRRLIVNSLLKRLFTQRKLPAQTSNNIKCLLDTTTECINSLKNLKLSTESWDPLLIYLTVQKLDPETHRDWEQYAYQADSDKLPTWEDLSTFLQSKFRTLELITPSSREKPTRTRDYAVHISTTANNKSKTCSMCKEGHTLCHCREFTKMQPTERCDYVNKNNLCYNCLAPGHSARRCRLTMSCRICRKRHHSLLHQSSPVTSSNQTNNEEVCNLVHHQEGKTYEVPSAQSNVDFSSHFTASTSTALLATALVPVRNDSGHTTVLRALIDNGSQATFISERAAQMLRLKRTPVNGTITGVGSTKTKIKNSAVLRILSRHDSSFNTKVSVYIMSTQLTSNLPSRTINSSTWPHIQGLPLADPGYHIPGRIDMLLGVDVCAQIMKSEVIKGPPGTPCAQNTYLGWILFGPVEDINQREEVIAMHLNLDIDDMLKRMWEHDKDIRKRPTEEERKCEDIFKATTTRTEDGRYIVKLPTKTSTLLSPQGETRNIALKRLYQLEKKLDKNKKLKEEYRKVMQEYIDLKHVEEVHPDEIKIPAVYLPHHAVVREEKETSKVRVVFNASQKGINNISLNDELLIGPQLQDDMRSLIMRWRMKKVCFTADIQKMYRAILVTDQDKDLQRILWRSSNEQPVRDYKLTRVTFGTASAPYLAVRTLHQAAEDEDCPNNHDAVKIIKTDFYMDDLMSGGDTTQTAIHRAKTVEMILNKGGFNLQKWCSNDAEFLKQFDQSQRSSHVNINITLDGTIKALGLQWNMGNDIFQYSFTLPPITETISKRNILADVQRLFDPLGWLAPVMLPTKILIQQLWVQGITWDESVDERTAKNWVNLRNNLRHLPDIQIDRWLYTTEEVMENISIHGFCDASIQAYGAVAYIRVRKPEGDVKTNIIAAKTRVAPVKPQSLPRLELNGAVLLAGLLKHIKEAMKLHTSQIYAWTDSTIVLSWLFGDPARWNTFVRNRVVEILDTIGNHNWYHVQSQDNPADLASRGSTLQDIRNNKIWWNGPKWLSKGEIPYCRPQNITTNLERKEIHVNLKIEKSKLVTKFKQCRYLQELLKIIIYSKRFFKGKKLVNKDTVITTEELDEALKTCIKIVQGDSFEDDIQHLKQKKSIRKESKLKTLQPYLDEDGVLKVGGRLRHSDLSEDSKHPAILDSNDYLSTLIVADVHEKTLHGGCQLMLAYLRSKFWILKAKKLVKAEIRKCLICARLKAASRNQVMGDLPRVRVTPSRPFVHSGVDFAGPYQVLMSKGRGAKTNKAYIALFICMSTKAIHLELVGDLTSEAFIGAFKRFVSRRGRCAHLWSDQGRNFVGANKELLAAWANAKLQFDGPIIESLALDGTQWHFIPAYSPHMGGLWEAGIKSMKYHLKRILTSHLTFEEMTTLLCQIEACLNSRPLTPIENSDTDNIEPLTPGHFLIGEMPMIVPDFSLQNIPISHLSRWQHQKKLLSDFWYRWQQEYLSRLQQRTKWQKKTIEYNLGQIVLIKNENMPPGKWPMGRIVAKHPGADGITRVYSVRSGDSVVQRSVCKLCPMPMEVDS